MVTLAVKHLRHTHNIVTESFYALVFFAGMLNEAMFLLYAIMAPFILLTELTQMIIDLKIGANAIEVLVLGATWYLSVVKALLLFSFAFSPTRAMKLYFMVQVLHVLMILVFKLQTHPFPILKILI